MVVFFRAVMMLAVLVGLPAAWIYYGPLPPGAQRVVDRVVEVVRATAGWQRPAPTNNVVVPLPPRFSGDSAVLPAVATQPADGDSNSLSPPPMQTEMASNATGLAAQVEPLLRQLRILGSTEYTLEPWGREGEFFRFRCAVPLAQDKQFTQQFEAVAETPQATIEQVVSQVTRWQIARLDGRQSQ